MPIPGIDISSAQPGWYEIRIRESIEDKWLSWFDEFIITHTDSGETLLTGSISDQSALHGLLARIRDLNLTLVSVNQIIPDSVSASGTENKKESSAMKTWLKNNSLVLFFALTFVITWSFWMPAVIVKINGGTSTLGPDHPLGQFGRWAPGIAAIVFSFLLNGRQGIRSLFRPLGIWRVNFGWYVIALFLQPTIFFGARLVDGLLGNIYQITSPLTSVPYPLAFVIPISIVTAFPGAFAEELGWRGFALPRLQSKVNPLTASVVLAFVWGIWHLPSMMYSGQSQTWGLVIAVLNFIPITILFTWVYNNTNGSLLLVTLLHIAQQLSNTLLGLIPSATDEIMMWLFAGVLVLFFGKHRKEI